jgi:hypothetical protein
MEEILIFMVLGIEMLVLCVVTPCKRSGEYRLSEERAASFFRIDVSRVPM